MTNRTSPFFLRRLAAMTYDILLVLPLIMVSVLLALGVHALIAGVPGDDEVVQLDATVVQLVAAATVAGFFSWFWIKNGQTLGMQAWRIKLVDFSGNHPRAGQALLRCLGATVSAACFGLGYLWCLIDRNGRYWHDYLSRTELVLLPKPEKAKVDKKIKPDNRKDSEKAPEPQ
tara:strand:+ start:210725 stop:211243 length:519 start_codon:yes stop_codon:yes gene_type:complete